ncbi:heavy-metal-associated domain-containing protein [Nocardiopsis mangrovi]|uniref:Heavy-metal-associated domain-containing protein n=1 Tax=Nocardiopsis mangrovi TaxID=1179818 RepID=A0ABV9E432_9ACTN
MSVGTSTVYEVEGMTCAHCAESVGREVGAVPGVTGVDVDVAAGRVTVAGDGPVDAALVRAAVDEAGYTVKS